MAFSLQRFAKVRPDLYHWTATGNLGRVRALRCLESAESLLTRAGQSALLRQRRAVHHTITIDGMAVSLRDQSPLCEGNIEVETGWTFAQVIALLNQRVFFWPGTSGGPIDYGWRHFARYEEERPVVIRVQTRSLLRANPTNPPLFCRYNSGSPRCSGGARSPRGAATFQTASENSFIPSEVVEVTFVGRSSLPDDAELRGASWADWVPLFPPTTDQDAEPSAAAESGGGNVLPDG